MQTEKQLFDPERHEPLSGPAWDEEVARLEMAGIVGDVACSKGRDGLWPNEDIEADGAFAPGLFLGAAGIIWAAHQLASRGYNIDRADFDPSGFTGYVGLEEKYDTYFTGAGVPVSQSYLFGPVGAEMVQWKFTPGTDRLDHLDMMIEENQAHPWMENLWGAPSTMLAAGHLFEATGEERFAEHVRSSADYLWDRLEDCEEADCKIWDILLYGKSMKLTGAGHGFIGNVFPVIRNLALFGAADQEKWRDLVFKMVISTARVQDGMVNWPLLVDKEPALSDKILVHQCHGAPGFVIGLTSLFGTGRTDFDDLLLGAGELVWRAGPLKKYPGICHGTPGNGYVFLKLWKATGDEKWLTRARAFAMAAIDQRARRVGAGEVNTNSLWEGDMGLAMFLADCIEGRSDFPTLDYF